MVLVFYFPFVEDNMDWDNQVFFDKTGRSSKKLPVAIEMEKLKNKMEEWKEDYIFEILL